MNEDVITFLYLHRGTSSTWIKDLFPIMLLLRVLRPCKHSEIYIVHFCALKANFLHDVMYENLHSILPSFLSEGLKESEFYFSALNPCFMKTVCSLKFVCKAKIY
jgi:hypothetical protein